MKPISIEQAAARLRKAENALKALKTATSYDEADEAWTDFLLACSTIYSKLEQGAKAFGKSQAWFGRKKKLRKDDPLLRYLHFARNSDEHGIEFVTSRAPGNYWNGRRLKFNEVVHLKAMQLDKKTLAPIRTLPDAAITGPTTKLVRVYDRRFGDYCDPPDTHLGKQVPFGQSFPTAVAEVAITYFKALIDEAKELSSE